MNECNELTELTTAYHQICRRLVTLKNEASQDNTSARMAYDQCRIALQNKKETLDHYLHELHRVDTQEKAYYLHAARQELLNFKELVHEAEIKVKNARPMPPFLY